MTNVKASTNLLKREDINVYIFPCCGKTLFMKRVVRLDWSYFGWWSLVRWKVVW